MRWMTFVILTSSVFCGVFNETAFAADEDWRIQRLNERYEDFFSHRKWEKEFEKMREAAYRDVLVQREKWDKQMDIDREQFIKNRPPPPNLDAAYREWAEQQRKYAKEYEHWQQQYVDLKDRIERLEKTAKKIPENVEYDLDNRYQ
jgi:hypothetical protein